VAGRVREGAGGGEGGAGQVGQAVLELRGGGVAVGQVGLTVSMVLVAELPLGSSELGQATCNPRRLQNLGPAACPVNSIMGRGTARAKFQVSPIVSHEDASLALVAGPSQHGYVNMLIAASGEYPVETRIVMSALLLPGRFHIAVPLVPGIPEGPDVAVVSVKATLGGRLTYYERRHGRRITYHPTGVLLPRHRPKGGFRFSATFSFLDGTQANATTTVRCPRR
jgi:hypothetical protein